MNKFLTFGLLIVSLTAFAGPKQDYEEASSTKLREYEKSLLANAIKRFGVDPSQMEYVGPDFSNGDGYATYYASDESFACKIVRTESAIKADCVAKQKK